VLVIVATLVQIHDISITFLEGVGEMRHIQDVKGRHHGRALPGFCAPTHAGRGGYKRRIANHGERTLIDTSCISPTLVPMPKAVQFDSYGGVDVLEVRDVPRPVPAAGEVLIEVVFRLTTR
jgi:hypothetical protein